MTQHQHQNEQKVFVIYLEKTSPVSPTIRLAEGGETWRGRLHHIPSGQITPLENMDDLLPAIYRYIQAPTQIKKRGGLK